MTWTRRFTAHILLAILALLGAPACPPAFAQSTSPRELQATADAGRDFRTHVGFPSEFHGYGFHPDLEILRYEWDFDGDGTFDHSSSASGHARFVYAAPGLYEAIFRIRDEEGRVRTDTVNVVVESGKGAQEYLPEARPQRPAPAAQKAGRDGRVTRYAVMLNGGSETRFWNDVLFMYPTLTDDFGFPPERIYLLNSNGTNPSGLNPDGMIDASARSENLEAAFVELAGLVDADDEVFVWVTDHGYGYYGPGTTYHGYNAGRTSVDPGDEQDYLESEFKLRSLYTGGNYRCNHGMEVWKVRYDYSFGYGVYEMYRNKFVSTFSDVDFERTGPASDSDYYIERFVDYLLGDFDRDGYIETDEGEVYDFDGDSVEPYDPATGSFDEDDWGLPDFWEDDIQHINTGVPGGSYLVYDAGFDNLVDIDIDYVPGSPEVDGTDLDGEGLFDGLDVNDDGDMLDWVSIDEIACMYAGDLYDDDLATYLDWLAAAKISVFMEQCFSGGFVEDLSRPNLVISAAAEEEDVSYGNVFVRNFTSALHRAEPDGDPVDADANGNGYISMMEAFNYAAENDQVDDAPQYDDNGDGVSHTDPIPDGGDGAFGANTYLEDIPAAVPGLSLLGAVLAVSFIIALLPRRRVLARRADPPAG